MDVKQVLQERFGVTDLFRNTADLSGMNGLHTLMLDSARQKAFIKVYYPCDALCHIGLDLIKDVVITAMLALILRFYNCDMFSHQLPLSLISVCSLIPNCVFLQVSEEGTKAAAVVVAATNRAVAGVNDIHFNRPFVFIIRETESNTILFMGRVEDPRGSSIN